MEKLGIKIELISENCYIFSVVGIIYVSTCSGSPGQQCCYNDTGNLVVGAPNGGSVDRFAPVDLDSFHKHIQHDVIPNVYCCPIACSGYYRKRLSDDRSNAYSTLSMF